MFINALHSGAACVQRAHAVAPRLSCSTVVCFRRLIDYVLSSCPVSSARTRLGYYSEWNKLFLAATCCDDSSPQNVLQTLGHHGNAYFHFLDEMAPCPQESVAEPDNKGKWLECGNWLGRQLLLFRRLSSLLSCHSPL